MTEKEAPRKPLGPSGRDDKGRPGQPAAPLPPDDEIETLDEVDLDRISGGARMPFSFVRTPGPQPVCTA